MSSQPARIDSPAADLTTPTIKANIYTTGRGGTGNMAKNDKERPDLARVSQDVEAPPQRKGREDEIKQFVGRGAFSILVLALVRANTHANTISTGGVANYRQSPTNSPNLGPVRGSPLNSPTLGPLRSPALRPRRGSHLTLNEETLDGAPRSSSRERFAGLKDRIFGNGAAKKEKGKESAVEDA